MLVDLPAEPGQRRENLQLGRERHRVPLLEVEEGLLAEGIPGKKQLLAAPVGDGERKHATELRRQLLPPLAVPVEQDFSVRIGAELVAARDQLVTKLEVVVNLPVEVDDELSVIGAHGLMALGQIDNRQTAVSEREPAVVPERAVIRPSMTEQMHERLPERNVQRAIVERELPENAAHG
jgi:hypothetical protein